MTTMTPRDFPKFAELPMELRLKIWESIRLKESRSRIVELDIDPSRRWSAQERNSHIPPSLHINRESRKEARKCYQAIVPKHEEGCYPPEFGKQWIFINPKSDIVMLDFSRLYCACTNESLNAWSNLNEICAEITQVVVTNFHLFTALCMRLEYMNDEIIGNDFELVELLRRLFPKLEKLCFIEHKNLEGWVCTLEKEQTSRRKWEDELSEFFEHCQKEDPKRRVPEITALPWRSLDPEICEVDYLDSLLKVVNVSAEQQ